MKLYKDICSAWISCTSAEIFFSQIDVINVSKNTIDLLLFYGEYFYGFSESDLEDFTKSSFGKTNRNW